MEIRYSVDCGDVKSVHHGIAAQRIRTVLPRLQGSGRIGWLAGTAPYPAEFIQTSGQTPPQLGIVAIICDELLVHRAACSASGNADFKSPVATSAMASHASTRPARCGTGHSWDTALPAFRESRWHADEANGIGVSTEIPVDDADVGKGPGESLLVARLGGEFGCEALLNLLRLLIRLQGLSRVTSRAEREAYSRKAPGQSGLVVWPDGASAARRSTTRGPGGMSREPRR